MLEPINVGHKKLGDYASLVGRRLMDQILELAAPLEGKRVLHLSATAFGGGVAEINYTLLPLMIDAGLQAEWRVIWGQEEFFQVTKTIHNALQGSPESLDEEQRAIYEDYNRRNAEALTDEYDFVIVHDPQPCAMIEHVRDAARHWIWRCHIDLSAPNRDSGGIPRDDGRGATTEPSSTVPSTFPTSTVFRPATSGRPRSTPWRRRTWRSRPKTPRTSSTSSGSTSTGRC